MGSSGCNRPCLQTPEDQPAAYQRLAEFSVALTPRSSVPKIQRRSENVFTPASGPLTALKWPTVAILALSGIIPAVASDMPAKPSLSAVQQGCAALNPSVEGRQDRKPSKQDIDCIGQRGIGNGANFYSLEKERALGQSMAAQIDSSTRFVSDPEIVDYINALGQKIARSSDAQVPFTIKVIDSPDLRTFALPGGFLYVCSGLITGVDSEAELAAMMAHEIAHVAARHATRGATRKTAWTMVSIPLASLGPAGPASSQLASLSSKKFSRDAEIEADLLGIEYQYAAGYDPQAFVDALEKLRTREKQMQAKADTQNKIGFLPKMTLPHSIAQAFASYPPTEERIIKLQAAITELLPAREDYICDTGEFREVKDKLSWIDRPILRRHRAGDGLSSGPTLHRRVVTDDLQAETGASARTILHGKP